MRTAHSIALVPRDSWNRRQPVRGGGSWLAASCLATVLCSTGSAQGDIERIDVSTAGVQANAGAEQPSVNFDGRFVVYSSIATNLVVGGTSGRQHVYLRDRLASTTTLITQRLGVEANGDSGSPVLSADGRFVAFHTDASNLGPVDANGYRDVYVYDRQLDAFTLVSNGAIGGGGASGVSCCPGISLDGRWVAFYSGAPDVVLNDTNGWADAFVFDRTTATTQIASLGPNGIQGDYHSGITGHGMTSGQIAVTSNPNGTDCFVAFQSLADNLVPGAIWGEDSVYRRDTELGVTILVSANNAGAQGSGATRGVAMSANARYVAFDSRAPDLVPGDTSDGDTFVRDTLAPGATVKASLSSQQLIGSGGAFQSPLPYNPSMSADGGLVVFETRIARLAPNDRNSMNSIYLRDLAALRTWRVDYGPTGAEPNGHCIAPWISGDGSVVVFASPATNLVANDTNGAQDIFLETVRTTTFGYCFGDVTGVGCPCANAGEREKGCENSHGTGGALLIGLGTTSVSQDSFVLAASTLTPNTSVLFLQGTGQLANVFGDGLRCVGGAVLRLGGRTADAGGNRALGHGIAGDPSVSVAGQVPSAGGSRYYQAWYRNAAAFCGPTTFNFSNGLNVVWTP